MWLLAHTNGRELSQMGSFTQHKFPDLTYLHSFTELFCKDFSLLVRINLQLLYF